MRVFFLIVSLIPLAACAQVLGGNAAFNFLKYSATPQLTALGGVNVSQVNGDPGLAFYNPALLKPTMHTRMNAVFNDHYGGVSVYHLSMAYDLPSIRTSFQWGMNYFNYGKIRETDPSGNEMGEWRPIDWMMQVSAARAYLGKWNYGASLKFFQSDYGQYRSNGVAVDFGILFSDTAHGFSAAALVQHLGTQFRRYGDLQEDLPFDLQLGLSKRLAKAPFGFSLTAQRLNRFDITYNDTAFNNENGFRERFGIDELFRHLVLAATVYIGDRVEIYGGYNFLRRRELSVGAGGNGLHGFSTGLSVFLGKLSLQYARAYYQPGSALNQLGLNLKMNEHFGLGKFGERIGW